MAATNATLGLGFHQMQTSYIFAAKLPDNDTKFR
jgi:hypothetical protein